MAARTGSAQWRGTLKEGDGTLTIGEGFYEGPYTFESRFGDGTAGTNPEELISSALAGCFSMGLGNALNQHGHETESITTKASAYIRQIDGLPTIQRIELETVGKVAGIDEEHFKEHAEEIREKCIVSRALGGVEEIELVSVRLES